MAASVATFGHTEWALRLPSALCGVLLIVLAYFVGRRFLAPKWNLAFVGAVALLPEFIVDAQTARMYVFFVTSVAAFLLFLFRWERTERLVYLAGAVLMVLVGLHFHSLMVFSAPLLLFPGLARGNLRMLVAGSVAFAVAVGGFVAIDGWVESNYPPPEEVAGFEEPVRGPKAAWALPDIAPWMLAVILVAATALAAFVVRSLSRRRAIVCGALIVAGLVAQALFAWHIAALLLVVALVAANRAGPLPPLRVAVLVAVCAVLAILQIALVQSQGAPLRQTLGAMTGWPSVWPYIVASGYSLVAAALVAIALARAAWLVAHRERVPEHVLFVVLGVWAPLFLIGLFSWNIPLRYSAGQVLPLLVGAFAAAHWLLEGRMRALEPSRAPRVAALVAAIACLAIANPILLARTVNSGYAMHPDHKGAAEFMRSVALDSRDVVLAEDVLQQYYYLDGRVDYWLVAKYVAAKFVRDVGGEPREIYLNVPVMGSGQDLAALLDKPDRGTVYVIGSGELHSIDGRRYMRGLGIQEVLDSPRFEVVYEGRDGYTKVWKAPPPSLAARQ
jgi:hypothetical protein